MNSHFTPSEWDAVFAHDLALGFGPRTDLAWRNVSQTQLSISRHYGCAVVNGQRYTYLPATDELIRDDVLQFVTKARRVAVRASRGQAKAAQMPLAGVVVG